MIDLRQWLGQTSEYLRRALEQSWSVAEGTWLPALGAKRGSYNSIPHLRNLESYLNRLCQAFCIKGHEDQDTQIKLSPVEIYIILAAILFHDIGRTVNDSGHGSHSRQMLNDHWSQFGIPSQDMASLIALVCEYHEPSQNKTRAALAAELTATSIAPYGRIRLRELAGLLRLIDMMDGAFTRVLPQYLRALKPNEAPGVFRALVQDVQVDATSQTIYTVLGDGIRQNEYPTTKSEEYYYVRNRKMTARGSRLPKSGKGKRYNALATDIRDYNIGARLKDALKKHKGAGWRPTFVTHIDRTGSSRHFSSVEWLLAAGLVHFDDSRDHNPRGGWNRRMLLAALMSDLRMNCDVLREERTSLARMGIDVRGWVMEYEEHLYDESGTETVEPILYKDYLWETAQRMWELSTQVFGRAERTYEELAAAAREINVDRIHLAVRRLSILTESVPTDAKRSVGIWVGPDRWRWLVRRQQPPGKEKQCFHVRMSDIEQRLDEINEPRLGEYL